MNDAVRNMEEHLGLPINSNYPFGVLLTIAERFEKITESDKPISKISLLYWLDLYGDFTEEKTVYQKIVNKIFTNLKPDDIMEVVPFIELRQKNKDK